MSWCDSLLDELAAENSWGYESGRPPAAEPTALAALALMAHGRFEQASAAGDWLADNQGKPGQVAVHGGEPGPGWPTGLAVLAWLTADRAAAAAGHPPRYVRAVERALRWIDGQRGKTQPKSAGVGHDPTLAGWPWVSGTHSWVEPTAIQLLALRAAGQAGSARGREAVRLLLDRQLPRGGWNYGNTVMLGQQLRPHLQPTGLALLALAAVREDSVWARRLAPSLAYLQRELTPQTATQSLAWGLLGLAAQGEPLPHAESWLQQAHARGNGTRVSPLKQALLAIAAAGPEVMLPCPPARKASR